MKYLLAALLSLSLVGCGPQPIKKGEASLVEYRISPIGAERLAAENNLPTVALYPGYFSVRPAGSSEETFYPREALIQVRWK